MTLILGIETSCDETAAAVVRDGRDVLSNVILTQHELHERYGGVVPEIASRAHLEKLIPTVEQAVSVAGISIKEIDAIAVGNRPGLVGSLLVGVSAAKALAWSLQRPIVGIDHVLAHLYAAELSPPEPAHRIAFPALGLVVSGGHTTLYRMESPTQITPLGRTIDDAVGEAYDKAAVILGLGYPGGPNVDRLAQRGNPAGIELPKSLLGKESLDFTFSGLKTALLYSVRGFPKGRGEQATFERSVADLSDDRRADLAAAFQQTAMQTIMTKIDRATAYMIGQDSAPKSLVLGGGVCANSLLRRLVTEWGTRRSLPICLPAMPYCLDNAAMIAGLAHHYVQQHQISDLHLPVIATTGA